MIILIIFSQNQHFKCHPVTPKNLHCCFDRLKRFKFDILVGIIYFKCLSKIKTDITCVITTNY